MVHQDLDYIGREMAARQVQAHVISEALWAVIGWARRAGRRSISLLSRSLLAVGRSIACRWRRDQALREFASLDARTLKDVGLHRGDAWAVAQAYACGAVYRRGGEPFDAAGDGCRSLKASTEASRTDP